MEFAALAREDFMTDRWFVKLHLSAGEFITRGGLTTCQLGEFW
jgi:hypothetical protein